MNIYREREDSLRNDPDNSLENMTKSKNGWKRGNQTDWTSNKGQEVIDPNLYNFGMMGQLN